MAEDRSETTKSRDGESQDGNSGHAQMRRLDESAAVGKGCEPRDNLQRDLLGDVVSPSDEAKKDSSSAGGDGGSGRGDDGSSSTYMYSNHSLI